VFFVTALALPGSLQAELDEIQRALFQQHGIAGARALPPLIPLAVAAAASAGRSRPAEAHPSAEAPPLTPADAEALLPPGFGSGSRTLPVLWPERYAILDNALYLLYSPDEGLRELARDAEQRLRAAVCGPGAELPFPAAPGALLAVEPAAELQEAFPSLPPPPAKPLRQAWWQVLQLTLHREEPGARTTGADPWWYAMSYEVLAERRIRKQRTAKKK